MMAWVSLILSIAVGSYVGKHWKVSSELRPWEKVVDIIGGILICEGIGLLPKVQSCWSWIKYALIIFIVVSVLHALLYGNKEDHFSGRLGTAVGITSMMFIRGFGFLGTLVMFLLGKFVAPNKKSSSDFQPSSAPWKGLPLKFVCAGQIYVCEFPTEEERWYHLLEDPDQKICIKKEDVIQVDNLIWEVAGLTATIVY